MTHESNYQAKQRRQITSASLIHLNSGTPLTFQPYIFDRRSYEPIYAGMDPKGSIPVWDR